MKNTTLYYQCFKLDPKNEDVFTHWIADDAGPQIMDYQYDENLSMRANSAILADAAVELLSMNYSTLKLSSCPKAIPMWSEAYFGTEVFYQDQTGTKRISIRVR